MKANSKTNLTEVADAFIAQLHHFDSFKQIDPYWDFLFPLSANKWCDLHISIYQKVYYLHESINSLSLEIEPSKNRVEKGKQLFGSSYDSDQNQWIPILQAAIQWMKKAEKNWVGTYKLLHEQYPLKYRKGIVPMSVVAHYFPEFKRVQLGLGMGNTKKMISLVDSGKLNLYKMGIVEKMTVNTYFEYCKLAYVAVGKAKPQDAGSELYKRLADGRHEGLLDIDPDSEQEFADWIDKKHPKRNMGGHPWEILRGGNTSNIQLRVYRPISGAEEKYKIEVCATGITRLAESIKIFLAIFKAGKEIAIPGPETIRAQLLLLDNVGIMPEHESLHRGDQSFEESENVHEVMYLYELRKHLAKIKPFINWEPLPVMPLKSL